MPTAYVKKLAKKHHTSVDRSEGEWSQAKAAAKKQGKGKNFAYITGIYKKMMGESVKELSLMDFLRLTEDDELPLRGASDVAYGGEKEDEFGGDEDFGDEFGDEDVEGADNMAYGAADDLEDGGHELADVIPPDELDDGEFGDDEFADDDDFGDDEFAGDEDFGDDEEFPEDRFPPQREGEAFGMLKSLMITEKKHGKSLKKAAKSVYHRDYVKTKNRPYRKYDPKAREHEARSQ